MDNIELLGIGFCAVDYVGTVSHIPINSKVEIENLSTQGGGASATAVVTASRLGLNTAFIGKTGDDENKKIILDDFKKYKVDASAMVIQNNSSSACTFVWIEEKTGKRSIAWNLGTKTPLSPQELNIKTVESAKILHLDGHESEAALEAIEIVKKNGGKVSLDGGTMTPNINEIVKNTDFLIVSEEFAKKLTGFEKKEQFLKKLKEYKSLVTIVTCGKEGFYGYIGEKYIKKETFNIKVVDTTGAGDVFHGAFLFAYLRRMNIEDALIFASAVASIKCSNFGVRSAIPSYEKTQEFIKKYKGDL